MGSPSLILYVEDNQANFALVQRLLQATGNYRVIQAESGERGLELAAAEVPALILLDLDLPGIDGVEVARQLRASDPTAKVPILVITASVMKQERSQAMQAGCDRFVEKPFDVTELRRLVDELLAEVTGE